MLELVQKTMFEKDYLHRTTGSVTNRPDIALTELIANAWDAGASVVNINLPKSKTEEIIIEDDGIGMTEEEFQMRWLTLAYNRLNHQGREAETPPDRTHIKRIAYGKNGIGRHGMLCFSDIYKLETWKNGKCLECSIRLDSGSSPMSIDNYKVYDKSGHGTKLTAPVKELNYNIQEMKEILSARYLYDPEFKIFVNNEEVNLEDHTGLILNEEISVLNNRIKLKIYIIDSNLTATKSKYHGVAFWVNKRLVGEPSWTIGNHNLKDGRTKFAKTHTIIIESDNLVDYIIPDWTGFWDNSDTKQIFLELSQYLLNEIRKLNVEKVQDTKIELIREYREDIEKLNRNSKMEVDEFINQIMEKDPDISSEELNLAVSTIINIKQSTSGTELLKKISNLSVNDIDNLNKILDSWDVQEIANTLDVIDYRISVIEAISRLCTDEKSDELHTLHPLIEQARWIFGPEFDSDEYTSNKTLISIIRDVIGSSTYKELEHPRKRPDLLIFEDKSLSCYTCNDLNYDTDLFDVKNILIIELKKGASSIGRDEMNQADEYVQEIAFKGGFTSKPNITAYVVGDKISQGISINRKLEDINGIIFATTYYSLVETAKKRLFSLRAILSKRYETMDTDSLVVKVLNEPHQSKLELEESD